MDREKLTNVYASCETDPTPKEVEWVIQNVDVSKTAEEEGKFAYQQTLDYTATSIECGCWEDIDWYAVYMNEETTDVPKEDWNYSDCRELSLLVCPKCGSWALCD